jgi:hypothetical protein
MEIKSVFKKRDGFYSVNISCSSEEFDQLTKKAEQTKAKSCVWCGETGNVVTKDIHESCFEKIMNGEGII